MFIYFIIYLESKVPKIPIIIVGPKLIAFLHLSAESGQLSSDSLSPEFRSLTLLFVHADHFINDCAYGSIGFIILDMSCE